MKTELVESESRGVLTYPYERRVTKSKQVTLGDLHGSTLLLLRQLIEANTIDFHFGDDEEDKTPDETRYLRFGELYQIPTHLLTKEEHEEKQTLIKKVRVLPGSLLLLRSGGDESGDRGDCDFYTWQLFDQIRRQGLLLETLFSNHGSEAVLSYESFKKNGNFFLTSQGKLEPPQEFRSTVAINPLIKNNFVTEEQVFALINDTYKPSLRCLSYSIDTDSNRIMLYSHAPVGLRSIKHLAAFFGVEFNDSSITDLGQTIDAINAQFSLFVQNNEVHTIYQQPPKSWDWQHNNQRAEQIEKLLPLLFLAWNRNYEILDRPKQHNGFNLAFTHCHDPNDPDLKSADHQVYDLDSDFGKSVVVRPNDPIDKMRRLNSMDPVAASSAKPDLGKVAQTKRRYEAAVAKIEKSLQPAHAPVAPSYAVVGQRVFSTSINSDTPSLAECKELIQKFQKYEKTNEVVTVLIALYQRATVFLYNGNSSDADILLKAIRDVSNPALEILENDQISFLERKAVADSCRHTLEAAKSNVKDPIPLEVYFDNLKFLLATLLVGWLAAAAYNKVTTGRFLLFQPPPAKDMLANATETFDSFINSSTTAA